MDRVCGLAVLLLLMTFRSFYHRRTEKEAKPKFTAVNFITFNYVIFFKMIGKKWKLLTEIKLGIYIGFYDL